MILIDKFPSEDSMYKYKFSFPEIVVLNFKFQFCWVLTSILQVLTAVLALGYIVYEVIENMDKDSDTKAVFCGSWIAAMLGSYVGPQYGCRKWPGWGGITGGMIGGVGFAFLYRVIVYLVIFFYDNFIKANVLDPY